ncbi:MAG TPA: TlpA disulfide reductase family protein [bacterium]|nr:TlpA disulfide reductase family protein [bacterium]
MTDRTGQAITMMKTAAAALILTAGLGACGDGDRGAAGRAEAATPATGQAAAGRETPAATPAPKSGGSGAPAAPDFALQPVTGVDLIRLADYEGKVVLIDFWATWCGPCRAAIPHLNELYDDHKDRGFEVLGVSVDQSRGAASGADLVAAFARKIEMKYPLAMADGAMVRNYGGITSIPTAFLIDRSGRVRQKYVGLRPKSAYEKDILKLLEEAPEPGTI